MNIESSLKGDFKGNDHLLVVRAITFLPVTVLLAFLVLSFIGVAGAVFSDTGNLQGTGMAAEGKLYVVNTADGNVSVIDTSSGQAVRNIELEASGEPLDIALNPDGPKAYVTDRSRDLVYVIDTAADNVAGVIKVGKSPEKISVAPDGRQAFVINGGNRTINGSLSIIDTGKNLVAATVNLDNKYPLSLVLSPDSKQAYVATVEDRIYVLDTNTGKVTDIIPDFTDVIGVSPDGDRLYVMTAGDKLSDNKLVTLDLRTKKQLESIPVGRYTVSAISPDGGKIYLTGDRTQPDNRVKVIDTSSNAIIAVIPLKDSPMMSARYHVFDIAVSPDGKMVYVSNIDDDYIRAIDTATNTEVTKIPAEYGHLGLAVS